ncbi:MAG: transposase [Nitrospira defluvii]|nr:transposase [Nitrospira defluvii]
MLPEPQSKVCLLVQVRDVRGGRRIIRDWVQWYNHWRPHNTLNY